MTGCSPQSTHGFGTRIQLINQTINRMNTMINTEIKPFNATAFKEGQFVRRF